MCLDQLTESTDTREKPYSCRCGAAFTRRDLLTRHWRISQHAGNDSVGANQLSTQGTTQVMNHQALVIVPDLSSDASVNATIIDAQNGSATQQVQSVFHEPGPALHSQLSSGESTQSG